MGLGTRIFVVREDNSLKCLSLTQYNRLIKGHPEEDLKQYAGKRILHVLIVVEMINRKPVEILMTEYSFLIFDSKKSVQYPLPFSGIGQHLLLTKTT
jgi:hypothetical protein